MDKNKKDVYRILVVSDTHGENGRILRVLEKEPPVDMIIHCGDADGDPEELLLEAGAARMPEECCASEDPLLPDAADASGLPVFYRVRGNCDFEPELPKELLLDLCGHRILAVHGHRHDVRYTKDRLCEAAEKSGADTVLFGHTHIPEVTPMPEKGLLIVNPGSLTIPKQESRIPTYAVLTLEEGKEPRADLRALKFR